MPPNLMLDYFCLVAFYHLTALCCSYVFLIQFNEKHTDDILSQQRSDVLKFRRQFINTHRHHNRNHRCHTIHQHIIYRIVNHLQSSILNSPLNSINQHFIQHILYFEDWHYLVYHASTLSMNWSILLLA